MKHRLSRLALPLTLALCSMPWLAHALGPGAGPLRRATVVQAAATGPNWLALPFIVLLMMTLQVLLARGMKAVAASASPLSTGEMDVMGYSRSVYGMPDRPMLEIVILGLVSGVVVWVGTSWHWGWVTFLGVLVLIASLALDLARWERVSVSSSQVWYQLGFGREVQQVAIDNILEVTVTETDAPGFSLRHLNRNRRCRLSLRLKDNEIIALPKTDAYTELDAVEAVANHIRTRQQLAENRAAAKRSPSSARPAPAQPQAPLPSAPMGSVPHNPPRPTLPELELPPAVRPVTAQQPRAMSPEMPAAATRPALRPEHAAAAPRPAPAGQAATPAARANASTPTAPNTSVPAAGRPHPTRQPLGDAAMRPPVVDTRPSPAAQQAQRPQPLVSNLPKPPVSTPAPAKAPELPPIDVSGSKRDREMMRELMRLRQRSQASNEGNPLTTPERPPRKA